MNDTRRTNEQREAKQGKKEKKPYAQPKLVKHGNVETLTKGDTGISGPIPH